MRNPGCSAIWVSQSSEWVRVCPADSGAQHSAACPVLVMAHSGRDSHGFSASVCPMQSHSTSCLAKLPADENIRPAHSAVVSWPKRHLRSRSVLSRLAVGRESGYRCPVGRCDRRSAASLVLLMAHSGRSSRGFSASCLSRAESLDVVFA